MYKVRKRNGKVVNFEINKISEAMKKAFDATNTNFDDDMIDFLAIKVTSDFENKVKDNIISVEDIQDSVESTLIKGDYVDVAKAYILYRNLHEKIRNVKSTALDYKNVVDSYLNVADWRVKEN